MRLFFNTPDKLANIKNNTKCKTTSNRLNQLQTHFSIVYPYNFPFVFSQFLFNFRNLIHNPHAIESIAKTACKNFTTNALVQFRLKFLGPKKKKIKQSEMNGVILLLFYFVVQNANWLGLDSTVASVERDFDMSRFSANRKQFRKRFCCFFFFIRWTFIKVIDKTMGPIKHSTRPSINQSNK